MRNAKRKDTRGIVCTLAIGLAAMCILPAAYRVWIHYNPPPERKSISEILRDAGGVRREELLAVPLEQWLPTDEKLAPDVRKWLQMHADTILPWEWSESAKKKDWKGYCDAWGRVVAEQYDALGELIARKTDDMDNASDRAIAERDLAAHALKQATNVLAAATNAYPVTVEVDEMTPGRLWGWNHRKSMRQFSDSAELNSFAAELRSSAERHDAEADASDRKHKSLESAVAELTLARDELAAVRGEIAEAKKSVYTADRIARRPFRSLLKSIDAIHRHRTTDKDSGSQWLPGRVRKWLGA